MGERSGRMALAFLGAGRAIFQRILQGKGVFSTMAESSVMEPAKAQPAGLSRAKATHRSAWSRFRWILLAAMLVAFAGGVFILSRTGKGESGRERGGSGQSQTASKQAPTAQVIKPDTGGYGADHRSARDGSSFRARHALRQGLRLSQGSEGGPGRPGEEGPGSGPDLCSRA